VIRQAFLFFLCVVLAVPALAQSEVRVDRYGAIVVEAKSGKILYAEHADRMLHPASLTKLMTLYMTFAALRTGKIDEDTELNVSAYAANASPTKLGLRGGETIPVRDAILGVVTRSANDAARVLAENLGGNESRFADMMTSEARRLGMRNTVFRNASGLPNPGQISTPKDMAILARAIIVQFPEYYQYFSRPSFVFRGEICTNHNHLMERYPGMDGMKTGYVAASGFNLVSSAVQNGTRLIGVVFGGRTAALRDDYMAGLLDRSFAEAANDEQHDTPRYAGTVMEPKRQELAAVTPVAAVASATPMAAMPAVQVTDAAEVPGAADAPTPPPAAENKTNNAMASADWGVQIGAYHSKREAQHMLRHAQTSYRDLHDAALVISPVEAKGGAHLYRAQLTGLTQSGAANACSALQAHGRSCLPVRPATG